MFMPYKRILCAFLLTLPSICSATSLYTDVGISRTEVKVASEKFHPLMWRLKLGYDITDTISVEGHFGTNAKDDSAENLKLEIDQFYALYARYTTKGNYNGIRMYFLLGQSKTKLKLTNGDLKDDEFEDLTWGVGIQEASDKIRSLVYTLEYVNFYDDSDLTMSGISLGLRFNF